MLGELRETFLEDRLELETDQDLRAENEIRVSPTRS